MNKFGEVVGFIGGYFLFTTVLFFFLSILNKVPENWSYFHIALIVLSIILIGLVLERILISKDEIRGFFSDDLNTSSFFKEVKTGFINFNYRISLLISLTLLLIVYIIGVGCTSLFAKLFKKHFLDLEIESKIGTYWMDLDSRKKPLKDYYRQF